MKLLNYTSIRYLLFTALLLLLSIPVSYFILNQIFTKAIDRDLYLQAHEIPIHQNQIQSERDLMLWRTLDKDLVILPRDSVALVSGPYTKSIVLKGAGDPQDFRVLQKEIHVLGKIYVVGIMSSLIEKEDLVKTILLIQLGIFCLLLAGAVVMNYFINKKVWRPFYQTLSFLENFSLEKPLIDNREKRNIVEFQKLNACVYRLTTDLRDAFLNQKEFTENASHELQSPLAVLKSKLELLLQDQSLSHNQSVLIDDMYRVIEGLAELNTSLLFLSKMDNHQFAFNESVAVDQLLDEVTEELGFMAAAKSQQIQLGSSSQTQVQGNHHLFKILMANLLRNAIQYAPEGAVIEIERSSHRVKMINPAPAITFDTQTIFNRFTKSGSRKGNGLGLAIAKKIATLHGWQLTYRYDKGLHEFDLSFDRSGQSLVA